jgi:DNA-binding NarL/FixJ family response regulator
MKTIRVVLADDHALFRAGLRKLFQKLPEVEVVAEAGDGNEALRLIGLHRPRVVLMDIMMPRMSGLEATARASSKYPQTRMVILSMNVTKEFVLQAMQAGAAGYLLKNNSPTELAQAVRAVARGEVYLSSAIAKHVVDACIPHLQDQMSSLAQLTPRQREVLQLIAEGETTKSIAMKLNLSTKTIETYRAELMAALDIHDIAGLVRYAIRMGIISPDW